jgi:hypothetical protein
VPGTIANGAMSATYTNKGLRSGTDTITVAVGNSSKTITLPVASANIGTIQFVGTDVGNASIVLRGSGGLGRKESAIVTFKVVDQNNNGIPGVDVSFTATTNTGGLTVLPAKGTTDSTGTVTTTVSSGTIPTPVRVIATATRNGLTLTGLSDTLTISTGLPIQKSMSMSAEKYNIEGLEFDNEATNVTVLMADQYGNPVSDGTTINFVTEGGAVGSVTEGAGACNTSGKTGGCTVQFRSQAFRPVNGRVTVLAYVQGLEDFVDMNGDGQYTAGEPFTDMGDAFLDAGSLAVTSGVPANPGTLDDVYQPANGDLPIPFNRTSFQATGDGKWGLNYIRRSVEIVFSGGKATLITQRCVAGACVDAPYAIPLACPSNTEFTFRLVDQNNNPLPAGTTVSVVETDQVTVGTSSPATVPSTNAVGGTFHTLPIRRPDTCTAAAPSFRVVVTTPKGRATSFPIK